MQAYQPNESHSPRTRLRDTLEAHLYEVLTPDQDSLEYHGDRKNIGWRYAPTRLKARAFVVQTEGSVAKRSTHIRKAKA